MGDLLFGLVGGMVIDVFCRAGMVVVVALGLDSGFLVGQSGF